MNANLYRNALAQEPVASAAASPVPFARGAYSDVGSAAPTANDLAALRAELKGDIRSLKALVGKSEDLTEMAAELSQVRELLEGLARPKTSRTDRIAAQVKALGIEAPIATTLAGRLRKNTDTGSLKAMLQKELAALVRVGEYPLDAGRSVIALVGPSGVGKTTTVAKLAARARIAGRSVALLACDTYRVGAVEQLARYASLLGVPCATVRSAEDLRAGIDASLADVVIVDTSGRSPTADGVETALAIGRKTAAANRGGSRSRHVLLCVPAAIRAHDAARVARLYAPLAPTALVVTKLDETDLPAGILHATAASKLPVSVVCAGQRVPEDIAPATVDALVRPFLASVPDAPAAA